jgi:hypothetical protein
MLIWRISRRISNGTVGRPQRRRDFQRHAELPVTGGKQRRDEIGPLRPGVRPLVVIPFRSGQYQLGQARAQLVEISGGDVFSVMSLGKSQLKSPTLRLGSSPRRGRF